LYTCTKIAWLNDTSKTSLTILLLSSQGNLSVLFHDIYANMQNMQNTFVKTVTKPKLFKKIRKLCKLTNDLKHTYRLHISYLNLSVWSPQHCKGNMVLINFTGGVPPQVPLCTVFQAWAGTWVEPPTLHKPAG
jgi:hypothetical protein